MDTVRVLGISGSLRKGSFNSALLRAAVAIAKEDNLPVTIDLADIREIPLYDEDLRADGGPFPAPVQRFRDAIAAVDAVLFVTPEYNYSVPGVLKNAIDWASRAPAQPFADKPFAVMGACPGMSGTMRAQYHLRQIAVFLDMHALNKPEIFVRGAAKVFDAELALADVAVRKLIAEQLVALADLTRRMKKKA